MKGSRQQQYGGNWFPFTKKKLIKDKELEAMSAGSKAKLIFCFPNPV